VTVRVRHVETEQERGDDGSLRRGSAQQPHAAVLVVK
jgi:hypothetical protein